jgi:riboflavin synthase
VNLERPLAAGGRFDGHIVQGHVDGVGRVVALRRLDRSAELEIAPPPTLGRYLIEKGSVAVDGVSLTVNSVEDRADGAVCFGLNLIPHTADVTTLGTLSKGDEVNLEIDTVARYLRRLESLRA